ncbi:hypothetical protein DFQ26_009273 [Actinomortierella ambigua]|nr:hypothetical protein DFQ26_009273 [Actinomortierella ambigua]
MADNSSGRSLLEMLQGGGPAGSQQQQHLQQQQHPQQQHPQQQQQQQQQQHPMLPFSGVGLGPPPHMVDGHVLPPFFHGGPHPPHPPPPMAQGMPPGFGFNRPDMDPQPMLMHMMQQGQQRPPAGPPPPMSMGFQSMSPHSRPNSQNSNALASLLQSLNQPSAGSTPGVPSSATPPPPASQNMTQATAAQGPPRATTSAPQMDLQASTESLKMALFGGIPPPPEPVAAAQSPHAITTEGLKMALFGTANPESGPPVATPPASSTNDDGHQLLSILHKAPSAATPPPVVAEQQGHETKREPVVKQGGSTRESATSSPAVPQLPSSRESTPQSSNKSKFTYVNPFLSFTSNSPQTSNASSVSNVAAVSPSSSRTATPTSALATSQQEATTLASTAALGQTALSASMPISANASDAIHHPKRSSVASPLPRREAPAHVDPATHQPRSQDRDQKRYQVDQLLPPHSAWNHRVQKLARGSSGVPDGVYLSHAATSAAIVYDTGLDNTDAIFSEDLETIPITLIPTEVEYNHGKMVAVSKGYISYAAKGGKIRVIQQSHGHRTLLRGHTDQVIDMGFSAESTGDPATLQLLASVGKDSRLIIWNLSGSDVDSSDIAHSKHMELLGVPVGDKARYNRVAWSPSEQYVLALVNNDEHSVIIVDIQKLMEKVENIIVEEALVLEHAIVIKAHDQPINDIAFSPDGTVLMTASEDGSVKLWEVGTMEATFLREFVPHGGLGVSNALFADSADGNAARCVITACRRGTELALWHVTGSGPLDQFTFKEPPASTRRSSLGKSVTRVHDMRMFNVAGYDFETQSLVLANSARLSLFGLKIAIDGEGDLVSRQLSQCDYLKKSLAFDSSSSWVNAKFEFMIEYPMPQPVVSFVVVTDSSQENSGFSVYCIQSKAVQQYVIKGLEPHDKHRCLTFVSAVPSNASKTIDAGNKGKAIKGSLTRSSSASSTSKTSALGLGLKDENVMEADPSTSPPTTRTTQMAASESGEKEPEKPFKLHGAVINGAIAKLKERKRNALAASTGGDSSTAASPSANDKKESGMGGINNGNNNSNSSVNNNVNNNNGNNNNGNSSNNKAYNAGRTSRKGSQDNGVPSQQKPRVSAGAGDTKTEQGGKSTGVNRQNRQASQRGGGDVSAVGPPSLESTLAGLGGASAGSTVTISSADLLALLHVMEDKVAARVEKSVKQEMEQQYLRMEESQVARQEELVKLVSQTLTKNTEQMLEQTVRKEIQSSVVPSLTKVISNTVERQLSRTITDAVVMSLPNTIDAAVSENVSRVMGSSTFMTKLTNQVALTIRPSVEESFKESFNKVLIPAYQKATQAMFQQITTTFEEGVADLTAANTKDQTNLEAIVTGLKSTNVDIQAGLSQIQAQLSRSIAAPGQLQRTHPGAPDDTTLQDSHGPRRASQLTSPMAARGMVEDDVIIHQCVARGDFEGAFNRALSTNDSTVVLRLCSSLSPRTVFPHNVTAAPVGALSQPILLALIHHLAGADMLNGDLNVRLPWLQECLLRLNSKDPLISEHISQILRSIQPHLQEVYMALIHRGDPSPHVQTLQMLLRAIQRVGM